MASWTLRRLAWSDRPGGSVALPARTMEITSGLGSGLARRPGDEPGTVWAIGDRGPNLKPKTVLNTYGVAAMRALVATTAVRVMPRLDIGPAISRLRVAGERVELVARIALVDETGKPVSGLPPPSSEDARNETAFDLDGNPIAPDPSGLDTEGIAVLPDGGFWVADEFGPSLVRVDATGAVVARYVPRGAKLAGARYPVHAVLPAIAARRHLNRGFEAIALSADGQWLFVAFQSPLAHPDRAAHERARHVRVWRLDPVTLAVAAQYLYPLDPPASFLRDAAAGEFAQSDVKVSELAGLEGDRLLVIERGAHTTKLYRIAPSLAAALGPEHLDLATRPTVEQLGAAGTPLPELEKELLFTSDDAPELSPDIEGMVPISPTELLLVNDDDFGVEGAETAFWMLEFDEPVLR